MFGVYKKPTQSVVQTSAKPNIPDLRSIQTRYKFGDLLPYFEANSLLEHHSKTVLRIHEFLGLPEDVWNNCVLPLIKNAAKYYQLLPASERHHHAFPGGLLEHSLDVCRIAAKRAKTTYLNGQESSDISNFNASRWKLAIVTAALLHDIGKIINDVIVRSEDASEQWNPFSEDLESFARRVAKYSWRHTKRTHKEHELIGLALLSYVIPKNVIEFIGQGSGYILNTLMLCLAGKINEERPQFYDLIHTSDKESTSNAFNKQSPPMKKDSPPLAQAVGSAIIDLIESNKWLVNTAKKEGRVWVASHGAFLVYPASITDLMATLEEKGVKAFSRNPQIFMQDLVDNGFFSKQRDKNNFEGTVNFHSTSFSGKFSFAQLIYPKAIELIAKKVTELASITLKNWVDLEDSPVFPPENYGQISKGNPVLGDQGIQQQEPPENVINDKKTTELVSIASNAPSKIKSSVLAPVSEENSDGYLKPAPKKIQQTNESKLENAVSTLSAGGEFGQILAEILNGLFKTEKRPSLIGIYKGFIILKWPEVAEVVDIKPFEFMAKATASSYHRVLESTVANGISLIKDRRDKEYPCISLNKIASTIFIDALPENLQPIDLTPTNRKKENQEKPIIVDTPKTREKNTQPLAKEPTASDEQAIDNNDHEFIFLLDETISQVAVKMREEGLIEFEQDRLVLLQVATIRKYVCAKTNTIPSKFTNTIFAKQYTAPGTPTTPGSTELRIQFFPKTLRILNSHDG